MSGGEALDLALGLLRAPARRELLAARSLPAGMTALLEVAGGSTIAARAAAETTGATPEELLEASRFFVQQVLFTENATAYRVLGASPAAPQAQLHAHHRHLQRWLHPDRDGGDAWDSAFSARVNEAWSRVRTPQARQAYDEELAAFGHPAPAQSSGDWPRAPSLVTAAAAATAPVEPGPRNLVGPLTAVAAVLLCICLAWLVHQRDLRANAEAFGPVGRGYAPDVPRTTASPDVGRVGPTYGAAPDTPDTPGTAEPPVGRGYAPDVPRAMASPRVGRVGPTYDPIPDAPADAPVIGAADADADADADFDVPPVAASAHDVADPASHGVGRVGPTYGSTATDRTPVGRGYAPDTPRPITTTTHTHTHTTHTNTTTEDPLHLLQQAEHAVTQATTYLGSDGAHIPPIWNDFHAEANAAAARLDLQQRLDGRRPGTLQLDPPRWLLGNERAVMDATYRAGNWRGREQGQLRIEMTRREQQWLITRVHLEPGA